MYSRKLLIAAGTLMLSLLLLLGAIPSYAIEADGGDVTDGASFATALGEQAECSTEGDVCTITLNDDVELKASITLKQGSYILAGDKTITRAAGFTEPLIILSPGTTLEITDRVVVDGGARWVKDGVETGSAVGAEDSAGATTTWALIDNLGGELTLSGSARVCNNDGRCAIWGKDGAVINIAGGQVHGVRSDDGGGAVACQDTAVKITGGELWGNELFYGFREPRGSAVYAFETENAAASTVVVSNGTIRDGSGPAAIEGANVTVTGGAFTGNAGAALGSDSASDAVSVSGGHFANNAGGLYAPIGDDAAPLRLSGDPSFASDADATVCGKVQVDGAISAQNIYLVPTSYDVGTIAVEGSDYELTDTDAAVFKLTGNAPEAIQLLFEPENNRVTVQNAQQEVSAADEVIALIEALPDSIGVGDEDAVAEAREAYEALSDEDKAKVDDA